MGQAKTRRRNTAEYNKQLKDKYCALAASCLSYDKGNKWEAPRIAIEVANFCHSGASTSILSALNFTKKILFLDTAEEVSEVVLNDQHQLAHMRMGDTFDFIAPLDDYPPSLKSNVKFNIWWNKRVIRKVISHPMKFEENTELGKEIVENMLRFNLAANKNNLFEKIQNCTLYPSISLTRRDIIVNLRNTDGGHVGKNVPEMMDLYNNPANQPWICMQGDQELLPINTVYSASIRQIGHELLKTVQQNLANLLPANYQDVYPKLSKL